jgi:hypothetical protein
MVNVDRTAPIERIRHADDRVGIPVAVHVAGCPD